MLNQAHRLHRNAKKAARKGNVEEAIRLHREAADILNQLLENILDEKVAESLRLQAELHEKEKAILRHQRKKAEKVYRASVIRNMSDKDGGTSQAGVLLDQLKIYDDGGMVEQSIKSGGRSFTAIPHDGLFRSDSTQDVVVGVASKKPKDDKVIIEELQVANSHLRKMVDSLFQELSSCQRENTELKARIRAYESMQGLPGASVQLQPQPSPNLGFRTFKPDSTPTRVPPATTKRTSSMPSQKPHHSSAISTENDNNSTSTSEAASSSVDLPPLPPLEMPSFDFDQKSTES